MDVLRTLHFLYNVNAIKKVSHLSEHLKRNVLHDGSVLSQRYIYMLSYSYASSLLLGFPFHMIITASVISAVHSILKVLKYKIINGSIVRTECNSTSGEGFVTPLRQSKLETTECL